MNAAELQRDMYEAKLQIDMAISEQMNCIAEDAIADEDARKAKSRAYIALKEQHPKATVGFLEAMVDLETADVQKRARMAEHRRRVGYHVIENNRQWLSALQSLASLTKAEAQLAKWESSEVA